MLLLRVVEEFAKWSAMRAFNKIKCHWRAMKEIYNQGCVDKIAALSLSLNECRGQCYDGASNMSGNNSGVAVKIQEEQPKAFATHCHCHSLSLSVKETTKNCAILENTINTSKEILTLIKFLRNVRICSEQSHKISKGTLQIKLQAYQSSVTRWTIRAVCFKIKSNLYSVIQITTR